MSVATTTNATFKHLIIAIKPRCSYFKVVVNGCGYCNSFLRTFGLNDMLVKTHLSFMECAYALHTTFLPRPAINAKPSTAQVMSSALEGDTGGNSQTSPVPLPQK